MSIPLTFVTSNKKKFHEFKQLLPDIIQFPSEVPEIQSLNIEEIVNEKVLSALKVHAGPLIVEDSSFSMDALHGLPGPFIKYFLETIGVKALHNIATVYDNYRATATMVLGYGVHGKAPVVFRGDVRGKVVSPQGDNGFGYDPLFIPDGYSQTNAQMAESDKILANPRSITVSKLKHYLGII